MRKRTEAPTEIEEVGQGTPKPVFVDSIPQELAQLRADREHLIKQLSDKAPTEDTGQRLNEELAKEARGPLDWGKANRAVEKPIPSDMVRIVDAIVVDDPWAVYEKLEKALRVGEARSDHGTTARALDDAEGNARLAHRLWVTAFLAQAEWEAENGIVFAAMRAEATAELQREKDNKQRNKAITDADVVMMAGTMFGDEWTAQEKRRRQFEKMVESMKHLAEVWMSRCRTIQTMHGKQR